MAHRFGKIAATIVGAVLVFMGVFSRGSSSGRSGQPEWAIAGAILIGSVLIASAFPPPPPPPKKPKPPHPLD
jgi:hypothetical protein